MPSPNEKLAESLDVLEALQQGNRRVFRSDDLSRVHRERLVENGFLQEVMKGWLISSSPDTEAGESTRGTRRSGNSAHATATSALANNGTCRRSSPFYCTARER